MGTPETAAFKAIGKPLPRKEDFRLTTGHGRYADDISMARQAYAAMVRSPYPHARILAIDDTAARSMPGVLAIFNGIDCRKDGLGSIPHDAVPSTNYDVKLTAPDGGTVFVGRHELLPVEKVRYVGEGVAIVIAERREQALDAVDHPALAELTAREDPRHGEARSDAIEHGPRVEYDLCASPHVHGDRYEWEQQALERRHP